jgi:hypothetical protein
VKIRHAIRLLGILMVVAMIASGCAYVNARSPYDKDLDKTDLGSKVGTAHAYSVLWLFAWGDASYATAARNGNITVMKHADQHITQVLLGLYSRWTVVVYGD